MFNTTGGGFAPNSSKKKAFTVPARSVFDFVATRDLSALKDAIDTDPIGVSQARDEDGYSLLHTATIHGHIDICRAFLGIAVVAPPLPDAEASQQQSSAVATDNLVSAAVGSPTKKRAASRSSSRGGGNAEEKEGLGRLGMPNGISKGKGEIRESLEGQIKDNDDLVSVSASGVFRPKSRSQSAAAAKKEAAQRLAGNSSLHPSELPTRVQLPTSARIDVNVSSNVGYTCLHLATIRGDVEMVKLFLTCGADPNAITRRVHAEPLTSYQLARKHHWPVIEHILEPLTLTPANGCRAGVVSRDGSRDAVEAFVESVDPLKAAEDGNILYFALALLDLAGPAAAVRGSKNDVSNANSDKSDGEYAVGRAVLDRIRNARCSVSGRSVLMIALDRSDVTSLPSPASSSPTTAHNNGNHENGGGRIAHCGHNYTLIVDLLLSPVVYVRRADRKAEDSLEPAFVPGLSYPTWGAYRLGYCFPTGTDGAVVRPRLVSDEILARKKAAAERRAAREEDDGEEERDHDNDEEHGAADNQGEAHNTTSPHTASDGGDGGAEEGDEDSTIHKADPSRLPYCVNAINEKVGGMTALHYAARHGHAEIVIRLVSEMGADATATDENGQTPKSLADAVTPQTARGGEGASSSIHDIPLAHNSSPAASIDAYLTEAELRKTFLDMFNTRDDVLPDDRRAFAEDAKDLKARWRDADRALKGLPTIGRGGKETHLDDRDYSMNNTETAGDLSIPREYQNTTAPSTPQRTHDLYGTDSPSYGLANAPTPSPE